MNLKLKDALKNRSFFTFLILCVLLIVTLSNTKLDMLADEGCYLKMIDDSTGFFDYSIKQYFSLNGRIVANAIMYFILSVSKPIALWVILTFGFVLLLIYSIMRIFNSVSFAGATAVASLLFCLGFRVLSSSVFWFTGAIFYIWPVSLTVYLLVPVSDSFFNRKELTFNLSYIINIFLGISVTLWSEQCALVLIGFYVLNLLNCFLKKEKKAILPLAVIIAVCTAFFCVLFFAPSQGIRLSDDSFEYVALQGGIGYVLKNGIYWTYSSVFFQQRIIVILFGLITLVFSDKSKNRILFSAVAILLGMALSVSLCSMDSSGFFLAENNLFRFEIFDNKKDLFTETSNPYVFWTLYMVLTLLLYIKNTRNTWFTVLVSLAASCTLIIMWFSPSLYVSGQRTTCLFCIALCILMYKIISENNFKFNGIFSGAGIMNILIYLSRCQEQFIIFY